MNQPANNQTVGQNLPQNQINTVRGQIKKLKFWQKITILGLLMTLSSGSGLVFLRTNRDLLKKETAQPTIYLANEENLPDQPLQQLIAFYQQQGYQTFISHNQLLIKPNSKNSDSDLIFKIDNSQTTGQAALKNWLEEKKQTFSGFKASQPQEELIGQTTFASTVFENETITGRQYSQVFFANQNNWLWQINLNTSNQYSLEFKNLKATLATITLPVKQTEADNQVRGTTTSSNEEKVVNLYQPAVIRIYADHCTDYRYTNNDVRYLTKTYTFCVGGRGSGFFVNSQGYLATNGHVVNFTPETTLIFSLLSGQENDQFYLDYMKENIFYQLAQRGYIKRHPEEGLAIVEPSGEIIALGDQKVDQEIEAIAKENLTDFINDPGEIRSVLAVLQATIEKDFAQLNPKETAIYLQTGQTPFEMTEKGRLTNQPQMVKATLIDFNYDPENLFEDKLSVEFSDVALLKADGKDFPSTALGTIDDLHSGEPILIMGYPAAGTDNELLDQTASAQLTATRGIVSAVKNAFGGQRKLIQTDATISPGSSGGPAFDLDGQVIGIATYGINGENFNYLVDVKEIKDLMRKNNVENSHGDIDNNWFTALSLFEEQKYKKALPFLETIQQNYPQHISAGNFVTLAKDKIENGQDRSSLLSDPFVMIVFSTTSALFALFTIITIFLTTAIKKKRSILKQIQTTSPSPRPINQTVNY